MRTTNRMNRLYERLEAFGINRTYARSVALPPGWNDADTENPAVYSQALGLLARNLNLSLRALQNDAVPLEWRDCGPTRFKRNKSLSDNDLTTAKCLAARAAQVACEAMSVPVVDVPESGSAIRNAILKRGHLFVSFEALLDYCWDCGIPVLHVAKLPTFAKKPDALAGRFNGRPAIVIMKNHKYAAWLLFILAHELGHIAKKHLAENSILVDEKVDWRDREVQEEEATACAVELLTGKSDIRYHARYNLTAEQLANAARDTSKRDGVDPGFVALNYADSKRYAVSDNKGHYAVGNLALSLIEPNANPIAAIRSRMCKRLNWEEMGRDSRHFLRSITETNAR